MYTSNVKNIFLNNILEWANKKEASIKTQTAILVSEIDTESTKDLFPRIDDADTTKKPSKFVEALTYPFGRSLFGETELGTGLFLSTGRLSFVAGVPSKLARHVDIVYPMYQQKLLEEKGLMSTERNMEKKQNAKTNYLELRTHTNTYEMDYDDDWCEDDSSIWGSPEKNRDNIKSISVSGSSAHVFSKEEEIGEFFFKTLPAILSTYSIMYSEIVARVAMRKYEKNGELWAIDIQEQIFFSVQLEGIAPITKTPYLIRDLLTIGEKTLEQKPSLVELWRENTTQLIRTILEEDYSKHFFVNGVRIEPEDYSFITFRTPFPAPSVVETVNQLLNATKNNKDKKTKTTTAQEEKLARFLRGIYANAYSQIYTAVVVFMTNYYVWGDVHLRPLVQHYVDKHFNIDTNDPYWLPKAITVTIEEFFPVRTSLYEHAYGKERALQEIPNTNKNNDETTVTSKNGKNAEKKENKHIGIFEAPVFREITIYSQYDYEEDYWKKRPRKNNESEKPSWKNVLDSKDLSEKLLEKTDHENNWFKLVKKRTGKNKTTFYKVVFTSPNTVNNNTNNKKEDTEQDDTSKNRSPTNLSKEKNGVVEEEKTRIHYQLKNGDIEILHDYEITFEVAPHDRGRNPSLLVVTRIALAEHLTPLKNKNKPSERYNHKWFEETSQKVFKYAGRVGEKIATQIGKAFFPQQKTTTSYYLIVSEDKQDTNKSVEPKKDEKDQEEKKEISEKTKTIADQLLSNENWYPLKTVVPSEMKTELPANYHQGYEWILVDPETYGENMEKSLLLTNPVIGVMVVEDCSKNGFHSRMNTYVDNHRTIIHAVCDEYSKISVHPFPAKQ